MSHFSPPSPGMISTPMCFSLQRECVLRLVSLKSKNHKTLGLSTFFKFSQQHHTGFRLREKYVFIIHCVIINTSKSRWTVEAVRLTTGWLQQNRVSCHSVFDVVDAMVKPPELERKSPSIRNSYLSYYISTYRLGNVDRRYLGQRARVISEFLCVVSSGVPGTH
ncbi:uncharacterized protein BT62DRAFT_649153 [Guyanagaster necrorhizus]|uniref:Uncharacterized protein n=1 Tax=Guyanagaster necrorhizus TaxID=856835 RepID=A0A9P7VG55_9AGAR|nr:uncharacterized protein BT62DRAFT_649153 [Guyanagaster necrorhizus MCA 3950]KAG7439962.1 hypothetical protein BT62DRAFT_649153 [Guyanagaster necrorhizus MCA 3950]